MSDPKTTPAFPVSHAIDGNWVKEPLPEFCGLTQYAEVAARFHAALMSTDWQIGQLAARQAFDHADAFFSELAKRTKS